MRNLSKQEAELRRELEEMSQFHARVQRQRATEYAHNPRKKQARNFSKHLQAVMHNSKIMAGFIKGKHAGDHVSIAERISLAGIFMRHAINRSDLGSVNLGSKRARRIYLGIHTRGYIALRYLALLALCLCVLWEAPKTWGVGLRPADSWPVAAAFEIGALVVLASDVALQMACATPGSFLARPNWAVYTLLVALMVVDALASFLVLVYSTAQGHAVVFPRFSRLLRPMLLPFLHKTCGNMFQAVLHTIPSLLDMFLLTVALVVFYAMIGVSLFGTDTFASSNNLGLNTTEVFAVHDFRAAVLELSILLYTADNYPTVLWSSFNCDEVGCLPLVGSAYFVSFVWAGFVMLLSVMVAVIFEVYKRQHAFLVLQARRSLSRAVGQPSKKFRRWQP